MSTKEKLALDLANAVLAAGDAWFGESWSLSNDPDREVVVVVLVKPKSQTTRIKKALRENRIEFYNSGAACSACGGTGKQ